MLRDYQVQDADAVTRVAVAAFAQFAPHYSDWPAMADNVSRMPELSEHGEIIVAEVERRIVGAVAYFGPQAPKPAFFEPEWPIIRMLVVDPPARGQGFGRLLTEECIRRARRDGASIIALHTTPLMSVALPMYLRMGFAKLRDAPDIRGQPYAVCAKALEGR
ncbi:GNAT family N-acetyltransferase [Bradyrhizobium manausense]|uniref:GNAT family N-acetyltransferase n=1 Tax=Bradyrhizobium TaxID=374 RepID=UPI001BA4B3CC|nr:MULTISPECIES: GNAT family N-acetyltransferase [Bradyrhizobium]MBR0826944.1 GNAT family N-acetyltransferase [Bradyrhizobium manausense]UVO32225.1 GNAT family N-acetyltransferase [Bradyrhizobium arachidis]